MYLTAPTALPPVPDQAMAFHSAPWLPGGHLQTIVPALFDKRPLPTARRERWDTPDGDFIDVDFIDTRADAPMMVLFHGLEGSSQSRYARIVAQHAHDLGWQSALVHFRGCSGSMNLMPRFYHSGDSAEIDWIVRRLRTQTPHAAGLHAVGVSLGGNALLKWLGELGEASTKLIDSAVAVSAPLDLHASGRALERGTNRIYTRMFLRSLKSKSLRKLDQFPGLFDQSTMLAARNLYEFDDVVTGPLHGFRDCNDYWTRASSRPLLRHIATPTLLLNARNDPFLPASRLPSPADVSSAVTLDFPQHGGHVGFWANAQHGGAQWLPERVFAFLLQHARRFQPAGMSSPQPSTSGKSHG